MGLLYSPNLLIFANGGLAYEDLSYSDPIAGATSTWKPGLRVGAGVDYALTDTIFLRAAYQADFVDFKPTVGKVSLTSHFVDQSTKLGIGMKF